MSSVSQQTSASSDDCRDANAIRLSAGNYTLRLATGAEDLARICALRFAVFNLELNEGLSASYATGQDQDEFDAHCDHLLVEDRRTGDVIGTYRMQDRTMANRGAGFYSDTEFVLSDMGDDILDRTIELGRACIHEEHRNTRVLFLLWKGLARYMTSRGHLYFFGCCSLTSQDPAEGHALYKRLQEQGSCADDVIVRVRDTFACPYPTNLDAIEKPRVPKLMRLYLTYGAKIVSGPALDREFSTIDYLTLFDIRSLDEQAKRLFLDG
ncbi:MAG: GNAT family N-acyltransferase [Pseudomonadota bacterium]